MDGHERPRPNRSSKYQFPGGKVDSGGLLRITKMVMAETEGDSLNSVFHTLADWEAQLKQTSLALEELEP